jgi:hypothetical protein
MSSARANAAARQRRANPNDISPMQQQQMKPNPLSQQQQVRQGMQQQQVRGGMQQQQRQTQPQSQQRPSVGVHDQSQSQIPVTKLSVSDAMALVTLRLGKVEHILNNLQNDPNLLEPQMNETPDYNENLMNIYSRMENIEKNYKMLEISQKNIVVNQPIPINYDDKIKQLQEKQNEMKNEMIEMKQLLLKVQSYSMDLSEKFLKMFFSKNKEKKEYEEENYQNIKIVDNDTDDYIEDDIDNDAEELEVELEQEQEQCEKSLNLKELIEKELA